MTGWEIINTNNNRTTTGGPGDGQSEDRELNSLKDKKRFANCRL